MRRVSLLLVLTSIFCASSNALASDEYPDVMATQLAAKVVPSCTICHASTAGGTGTVVKSFGIYLQSRGLTANNPDSLKTALQAMIGEKHDTDGDGKTDEQELKDGSDPNGDTSSNVPSAQYGCGRIAPAQSTGSAAAFIVALGGLALVLRRRRP